MKRKPGKLLFILSGSALLFQSCGNSEMKNHSAHTQNGHFQNQSIEQHLVASPARQVLSRQATIKLSAPGEMQNIKAQGYIDFDRNRFVSVSARVGGRIEKLYVKFSLQFVKKGAPIMDLYSPELSTYEEEHLLLLKTKVENSLLEMSREKLRLLGMAENQISRLEREEILTETISVFSPADGYVFFETNPATEKISSRSSAPMQGMNMNGSSANTKSFGTSGSQIREGSYVNTGHTLFSVNDLNTVWAVVSVSNKSANDLKVNQSVNIRSELFPGKIFSGKIILIEPAFEETEQRFARVRVMLNNPGKSLKLNSLVSAEIPFHGKQSLQVPVSAVYRTGLNAYVWLKAGTTQQGTGIFELRKVIIGSEINNMLGIASGLSPDDEIAKEAGLLTDSETLLNSD